MVLEEMVEQARLVLAPEEKVEIMVFLDMTAIMVLLLVAVVAVARIKNSRLMHLLAVVR